MTLLGLNMRIALRIEGRLSRAHSTLQATLG
jgi:hypothetical protein